MSRKTHDWLLSTEWQHCCVLSPNSRGAPMLFEAANFLPTKLHRPWIQSCIAPFSFQAYLFFLLFGTISERPGRVNYLCLPVPKVFPLSVIYLTFPPINRGWCTTNGFNNMVCIRHVCRRLYPLDFHPGDIIHVKVLGQSMIILGSMQRCNDIFEKRSSLYSDRVRLPMINEL